MAKMSEQEETIWIQQETINRLVVANSQLKDQLVKANKQIDALDEQVADLNHQLAQRTGPGVWSGWWKYFFGGKS